MMPQESSNAAQTGRRLRAIFLPPMAWQPERDAFRDGAAPDPFELDRHLAVHGIDTTLIDPGRRPRNPLAGRGTVLESLDPMRALRVMLAERQADIVVSVFEGAALPIALLRRALLFRVPLVVWDLGLTETWPLRERILDQVVPRVDGVFVLSASQKTYVENRWHRQHGVEWLGHAVDVTFFQPQPANTADNIPLLSIGDDAGRDMPTLLAAMAGLHAKLLIKTSRLPENQILPANVSVLRDRISALALRGLYANCRIVVLALHPTLNASGVSAILEAGAMGRAMIVSDNPAIRDFIVPDETCLVVPCGDAIALRAAIDRLLREPDTCARLGANARRFIERTCSRSVLAARLASLLRQYAKPESP